MSLTTNTVGTSVPTPKSNLRDAKQPIMRTTIDPSALVKSGTVLSLPNADKTKLNEALARMDQGVAERVLIPAAERKAVAEKELAALQADTTVTQPEKTERADHIKRYIDGITREIECYSGTVAYSYYKQYMNELDNKK